jgi:two-component system, sensor histidine kinase and response regulator
MHPETLTKSAEALDLMRARHRSGNGFDLVLIDANMPAADGFDLAGAIKRDFELRSSITMMLTSSDWRTEVARCEQLGIAAYLTKPIKQSELFDMIAKVVGVDVESQPRTASEAAEIASRLRPLRILLAEDSVVNQKLALGQLEPHGHQVAVVNNGTQAIEAWEAHPFDLILMDVQMPEMDGLTATRTIRVRERRTGAHVPIVAMTAHAMKGDRERCLAAGMDAYLSKPVRAKELFATIEQLFVVSPSESTAPGQGQRERGGFRSEVVHDRAAPGSISVVEDVPRDVLDWNEALQQCGVGAEVLREMAALFLDESSKLLTEIRQAMARGDAPGLRRAAHTLKGAAASLSARLASESARRLETIAKEGRLDEAEPACANLEREIERLRPALAAKTRGRSD